MRFPRCAWLGKSCCFDCSWYFGSQRLNCLRSMVVTPKLLKCGFSIWQSSRPKPHCFNCIQVNTNAIFFARPCYLDTVFRVIKPKHHPTRRTRTPHHFNSCCWCLPSLQWNRLEVIITLHRYCLDHGSSVGSRKVTLSTAVQPTAKQKGTTKSNHQNRGAKIISLGCLCKPM